MSIIIKGIEMPKNCEECPIGEWEDSSYFQCVLQKYSYKMNIGERLETCPLVEVMDYSQVNGITPTVIKNGNN